MRRIEDIFKKFSFSDTRCYVIRLTVMAQGYMKIEHKLPSYIQQIKHLLVIGAASSDKHTIGLVSLNFNGHAYKTLHRAIPRIKPGMDCPAPYPFDEDIQANSFLQGYYYDISKAKSFPYSLTIYIHYTPVPKD